MTVCGRGLRPVIGLRPLGTPPSGLDPITIFSDAIRLSATEIFCNKRETPRIVFAD
jgi:hypothetical protein